MRNRGARRETLLNDLEYLASGEGMSHKKLQECQVMRQLLSKDLVVPPSVPLERIALALDRLLVHTVVTACRTATIQLESKKDLLGNKEHQPEYNNNIESRKVFDVAAAGELLGLHDSTTFETAAHAWLGSVEAERLTSRLLAQRNNRRTRRLRQECAGVWIERDGRTVRRVEAKLLQALEEALTSYLSNERTRLWLTEFLTRSNDKTTAVVIDVVDHGLAEGPLKHRASLDDIELNDAPLQHESSATKKAAVSSVKDEDWPASQQTHRERVRQENARMVERHLVSRFGLTLYKFVLIAVPLAMLLWVTVFWLAPIPTSPPLLPIATVLLSWSLGWVIPMSALLLAFSLAALLRSIRTKFTRVTGTVIATLTILATLSYMAAYVAASNGDTDKHSQLLSDSQNWDAVNFEDFVNLSRCDALRQVGVDELRQCNVKDGFMQLAASRDRGGEILLYPDDSQYANLNGDFFAETRFRAGAATAPMSCGLAIDQPRRASQGYFHLVQSSKNRYVAELADNDSLVLFGDEADEREVYAQSTHTLPYLGQSRVFESSLSRNTDQQFDGQDGWIKLTIGRRANFYEFFVNERLAAKYSSDEQDPVSVHLAVISGIANPGGATACDFDYFTIYAKP